MYYRGIGSSITEDQIVDTGQDLLHGGIITISLPTGNFLYHGDFDGAVWSDPTTHRRAKIYKRSLSDLSSVTTVQFVDDLHHQNICDVMYSSVTELLYVLFMGNACVSTVNPSTLAIADFNVFEDLSDDQQMGKLALSDDKLFLICQLYPHSLVISYDLETGAKVAYRYLNVPAAHGGIYFNKSLYVTTSQNDDLGTMLYRLDPTTLRITGCKRLTNCLVATHEMAGMINPYTGVPYLFIGDENEDQDPTGIANVTRVNANSLWDTKLYTTNSSVQGGIWGVKAQNDLIWISRGSNPGTVEMLDPWEETSTFLTFSSSLKGVNGTVDVVGNTLYLKSFPRILVGSGTSPVARVTIN